jgi:hypothetical protein
MKIVEVNWTPTARQLRQFGLLCLVGFPLLGWIWSAGAQAIIWLAGIGFGLAVTGLIAPMALKPVFIGLTLIALPIGMVVSEVVMMLIYFGVFLPIGLCFKLMKRDALKRSLDRNCRSYWEVKKAPKNAGSYYRQW